MDECGKLCATLHPCYLGFYHLNLLFADYTHAEVLVLGINFWIFLFLALKKAAISATVQPMFTMWLLGWLRGCCGLHWWSASPHGCEVADARVSLDTCGLLWNTWQWKIQMVNRVPGWWWWEQMSTKSGWSGKSGQRLGPGLCIGQCWRGGKCGTGEIDESGMNVSAQIPGWRSEWDGLLMHCVSNLGCKAAAELLVVAGTVLRKCSAVCESRLNKLSVLKNLRCWITLQVMFWGSGQVCKGSLSNFATVDFQGCFNLISTTFARRRKRLLST